MKKYDITDPKENNCKGVEGGKILRVGDKNKQREKESKLYITNKRRREEGRMESEKGSM